MPEKETLVRDMIARGEPIPIASEYREQLFELNPSLVANLYPINKALYFALQKIGYYIHYS